MKLISIKLGKDKLVKNGVHVERHLWVTMKAEGFEWDEWRLLVDSLKTAIHNMVVVGRIKHGAQNSSERSGLG